MSSTNHTTNYNLPQFIGTDKPAWLGDVNPALAAIDAQMKLNADAATAAAGAASTADGKAVAAAGAAATADGKAETAQTTANGAAAGVSALASKLTFTDFQDKTAAQIFGSISGITLSGNMKLSQNADGSMFKFYNFVNLANTTNANVSINLTAIPGFNNAYGIKVFELNAAPEEAYSILCAGNLKMSQGSAFLNIYNQSLAIGSDGGVYFMVSDSNTITIPGGQSRAYNYLPCLYFNANFND